MADYKHGAYGEIRATDSRTTETSKCAIVYVGTAPVHSIDGGASNVNVPVVVHNIAEAREYFGYSDDWAKYTLCEAMHVHFENKAVGPLVLINVLNPATHKASAGGTVSKTPKNGRVTIPAAQDIILDTVEVKSGSGDNATTKVKGIDYAIAYSIEKETLTITELAKGALGAEALTITYSSVDASTVTADDVIGSSDGMGMNTGIFAIQNVQQKTGLIPSYLCVPGFSGVPAVHAAMEQNSVKVNGHWDVYMFVNLPIMDGETALTLDSVVTYKNANGYDKENETVYFPMANGIDGKTYHVSVLSAANFQELLSAQDGIPYKTASNTDCPIIENLYQGEANVGRVYDDSLINEKLNKNGIASAAYVGGRWAIWGCHSADYSQSNADQINVAETNRMMLYYISNDFQYRRMQDVDKPMTYNDLQTIVSEEQARLDALVNIGALTRGVVTLNATAQARSDIMEGNYSFTFDVTTMPLGKSLTAIVNWTNEGLVSYFESAGD